MFRALEHPLVTNPPRHNPQIMRSTSPEQLLLRAASDSTRPLLWPPGKRAAASAVHQWLLGWLANFPAVAASRNGKAILWTSLLTAHTFDGVIDQTAHEFAAQSLVLFMYDEVVDDTSGERDKAALDVLTAMREAAAAPSAVREGPRSDLSTEEQVVAAFAESMTKPAKRSVSTRWTESFRGIVETTVLGHLRSEEWRKPDGHVPSLAEHLEMGSYTAGAPVVAFGAAMTTVPPGVSDEDHDDYLAACLDLGWCVRAANDAAGFVGDVESGQINAVSLGVREGASSELHVVREMLHEVNRKITAMFAIAGDSSHPLSRQYRWLANSTEFHVDWYLIKNGYSFTVEDWLAFDEEDPFSEAMLKVLGN